MASVSPEPKALTAALLEALLPVARTASSRTASAVAWVIPDLSSGALAQTARAAGCFR